MRMVAAWLLLFCAFLLPVIGHAELPTAVPEATPEVQVSAAPEAAPEAQPSATPEVRPEEKVPDELVIVLLARDGYASVDGGRDGSFAEALTLMIGMAEAHGRNVTVYGPARQADTPACYRTGEQAAADWLQLAPAGTDRMLQYTVGSLTEEDVAGNDVLLLVGGLAQWERSLEKGADVLQQAASIRAVAVTREHGLSNVSPFVKDAPLTNTLIRCGLLSRPGAGVQPSEQDGWLVLDERVSVREYDAAETTAARLMSALLPGQTMVAEPVAENTVIIVPEMMKAPILCLPAGVAGEESVLEAPDGTMWPLLSADGPFRTVRLANGAVLVIFDGDAHGRWGIGAPGAAGNAKLYYLQKELEIAGPVVKDAYAADAAYVLQNTYAKGQPGSLALNDGDPQIASLMACYGDGLTLRVASADGRVEALADGTGFIARRAGVCSFDVSLMLYGRVLATERYEATVANAAPVANADAQVFDALHNVFWDVEYPDGKAVLSLAELANDADGDALTWTVAPQGGAYASEAVSGGVHLQLSGDQLAISWTHAAVPEGPVSFSLRAEDGDGGACEQAVTLTPRSMKRELETIRLSQVEQFDPGLMRVKDSVENVRFRLEGSEAAVAYLRAHVQSVEVSLSGQADAWKPATRNDRDGSYQAEVQYDRPAGRYDITVRVRTDAAAPVAFERTYPYGTIEIGNTAPVIREGAAGGWRVQVGLTGSVDVLNAQAFEDQEGDPLTYRVTITDRTPFGESSPAAEITAAELPYRFTPEAFGIWEVRVVAVESASEQLVSEPLTVTSFVVTWYVAAIAGGIVFLLLLTVALIIRHLLKPVFPMDGELIARLKCDGLETEITMHPERWRREAMPLDRVLASMDAVPYGGGDVPLLTEETCRQLGKVSIRPHRKGFVLIDRTDGRLLRNVRGRVAFDDQVFFDLMELSVTLWLQRPEDGR